MYLKKMKSSRTQLVSLRAYFILFHWDSETHRILPLLRHHNDYLINATIPKDKGQRKNCTESFTKLVSGNIRNWANWK